MKQRPCRFSGRGAAALSGRIPGPAGGVGGHGALAGGAGGVGAAGGFTAAGGGIGHMGPGGLGGPGRLVGGCGGGHDGGARGRLLGNHAAGMGADVGGTAAAREQGSGQRQRKGKAQDLFHINTSCQNADEGSLPHRTGDKRGNFYEKENF